MANNPGRCRLVHGYRSVADSISHGRSINEPSVEEDKQVIQSQEIYGIPGDISAGNSEIPLETMEPIPHFPSDEMKTTPSIQIHPAGHLLSHVGCQIPRGHSRHHSKPQKSCRMSSTGPAVICSRKPCYCKQSAVGGAIPSSARWRRRVAMHKSATDYATLRVVAPGH